MPKTRRWQEVLVGLEAFAGGEIDAATIGNHTLQNVRSRFDALASDEGFGAAFTFLIALGVVARGEQPPDHLGPLQIELEDNPLGIAKCAYRFVDRHGRNREYAEISKHALADAITEWFRSHNAGQGSLFGSKSANADVWRPLGDGAGFSEVSRLFVAKVTERYINYFLEREASSMLPELGARERLRMELSDLVGAVSRHAFDSAQITQSFAAGWYNKYVRSSFPTKGRVRGFLTFALHKMREELRRQERAA